jgi:hypothetical protein
MQAALSHGSAACVYQLVVKAVPFQSLWACFSAACGVTSTLVFRDTSALAARSFNGLVAILDDSQNQ